MSFIGAKMKQQQKFYDWLTRTDGCSAEVGKVDKSGLEIFSYLAYETVGQVVEISLLVSLLNSSS